MKALVLCAGPGTRLGELTRNLPKVLLPIAGEPLLGRTLRYLARYGFDHVAINLHHHPEQIRDYVGSGSRFGVDVIYSYEEELAGTAGAVRKLASFFEGEEDFLVMYGDLLIDEDLGAMVKHHRERSATATLLLHQRPGSNSLVDMAPDGRITAFLERPTDVELRTHPFPWVNSGLQILTPALLPAIPAEGPSDLPRDIYAPGTARLMLHGYPLTGYRCAIDSAERYRQAEAAVNDGRYSLARSA